MVERRCGARRGFVGRELQVVRLGVAAPMGGEKAGISGHEGGNSWLQVVRLGVASANGRRKGGHERA